MNSNYNRPEIWQDQLGNFATGGSLYARTPSTELQLLSFDMPSFDAGCGGININFGGFGYISGKQIQMLIKQIGTNALSYTVMLTIKSISPQIADLLDSNMVPGKDFYLRCLKCGKDFKYPAFITSSELITCSCGSESICVIETA